MQFNVYVLFMFIPKSHFIINIIYQEQNKNERADKYNWNIIS